jgi:CheY-like chemotaxis protein
MKKKGMAILMVDDDAEDRLLLNDVFDELGYGDAIHFEENGEGAIAYLQGCTNGHLLPSLIILDLNMPRLNGRQTLEYLKSQPRYKDIKVIIYSTSLNPVERDECLALGAHSYIVKPATYNESVTIANTFYSFCTENKGA